MTKMTKQKYSTLQGSQGKVIYNPGFHVHYYPPVTVMKRYMLPAYVLSLSLTLIKTSHFAQDIG